MISNKFYALPLNKCTYIQKSKKTTEPVRDTVELWVVHQPTQMIFIFLLNNPNRCTDQGSH